MCCTHWITPEGEISISKRSSAPYDTLLENPGIAVSQLLSPLLMQKLVNANISPFGPSARL